MEGGGGGGTLCSDGMGSWEGEYRQYLEEGNKEERVKNRRESWEEEEEEGNEWKRERDGGI